MFLSFSGAEQLKNMNTELVLQLLLSRWIYKGSTLQIRVGISEENEFPGPLTLWHIRICRSLCRMEFSNIFSFIAQPTDEQFINIWPLELQPVDRKPAERVSDHLTAATILLNEFLSAFSFFQSC